MRWFLSFLFLGFVAAVHALSSSGSRLLVILEDEAEKSLYSTFWSDLEGELRLRQVLYCLYTDNPRRARLLVNVRIAEEREALSIPAGRTSIRPHAHPSSEVEGYAANVQET